MSLLTFIVWNVVFTASCNWSPALLHHFLYQLPDYSAVVHPKEGVERMWGEEKEKSQFSQPHWWLPYGGFQGKAPLNPSTQTTVNILLLPWHNYRYSSVWSILTASCLIIGLYIVLRWAGCSGLSDQWSNHIGKEHVGWRVLRPGVVCLQLICYQRHSKTDYKKPHLNQIFHFMYLSSKLKFLLGLYLCSTLRPLAYKALFNISWHEFSWNRRPW